MSCVVCGKATKNTTKCTKCQSPFCTTCLKHRKRGRCPNCPHKASAGGGAAADLASNDFDSPNVFGGSDGFSYFVFEESVPYKIIPSRSGFTGFSPKTKKIMGSIQQNFNPDDQGEDDLDDHYRQILAEFRCHGHATTTGHCEVCGLEIWEPDWSGRNYFEEEEEEAPAPAQPATPEPLVECAVGDQVMATWKSPSGTQYPATVAAINSDGTLSLHYADGGRDEAAAASHVKSVTQAAADATSEPEAAAAAAPAPQPEPEPVVACAVGDQVMATWKSPSGTQYPATVAAINSDGTLSLHYADGGRDEAAAATYVKSVTQAAADVPAASQPEGSPSPEPEPEPVVACAVGDQVMATWKKPTGTEYPATVAAINPDGTLSLHYADGGFDEAAAATYVKSVTQAAADAPPEPEPEPVVACEVGDRVMATWKKPTGTEYPATVAAINPDGTLSLHYDDGGRDEAAAATYVKSKQ